MQLLNDVLDMEKVDTGRLAFAPAPCVAVAVMEDCTREMQDAARTRGITLAFSAFGSRDEALAALFNGQWAAVLPRALPHERVTDVAAYTGQTALGSMSPPPPPGPGVAPPLVPAGDYAGTEFSITMSPAYAVARATVPMLQVGQARRAPRVADFGAGNSRVCVSADAQRLRQIFYNLIMNAVRASASGSRVLAFAYIVRAAGVDDVQFCFGVQDCGCGMDAERAVAVGIEPLQDNRLSGSSSLHGRAGLGLSLAKIIVHVRIATTRTLTAKLLTGVLVQAMHGYFLPIVSLPGTGTIFALEVAFPRAVPLHRDDLAGLRRPVNFDGRPIEFDSARTRVPSSALDAPAANTATASSAVGAVDDDEAAVLLAMICGDAPLPQRVLAAASMHDIVPLAFIDNTAQPVIGESYSLEGTSVLVVEDDIFVLAVARGEPPASD